MAKKQTNPQNVEVKTMDEPEPGTPKIKPAEKPFNPDEEALLLFWQVEELLKKSEVLQLKTAQLENRVPQSLVVTTNQLRACFENMRRYFGK